MWAGLIQSVEGLKRKKIHFPQGRREFCLQTAFGPKTASTLPCLPACQQPTLEILDQPSLYNRVSQFLKTPLSLPLSLIHRYRHIYIWLAPCSAQTHPSHLLQNLAPAIPLSCLISFSSPVDDFLLHKTYCYCSHLLKKNLDFISLPAATLFLWSSL